MSFGSSRSRARRKGGSSSASSCGREPRRVVSSRASTSARTASSSTSTTTWTSSGTTRRSASSRTWRWRCSVRTRMRGWARRTSIAGSPTPHAHEDKGRLDASRHGELEVAEGLPGIPHVTHGARPGSPGPRAPSTGPESSPAKAKARRPRAAWNGLRPHLVARSGSFPGGLGESPRPIPPEAAAPHPNSARPTRTIVAPSSTATR